jgi:mannose-6-phosphate isomerase-like protein (cupin superfamily)
MNNQHMMYDQALPELQATITAWQNFLNQNDWQKLIDGVNPKQSDCLVYELSNFLDRPNEDFAIADMRQIQFSEPHYHPDKDIEIYFVIQGSALTVIGNKELNVATGDVIVIPPYNVHYAIPDKNFVIAVVNIPPFNPKNYIVATNNDPSINFNQEQFNRLTAGY